MEAREPPGSCNKVTMEISQSPQRGPKNCDCQQLDTWGRPTGQTPCTGQGRETEGEDDAGLGDVHLRVGPLGLS